MAHTLGQLLRGMLDLLSKPDQARPLLASPAPVQPPSAALGTPARLPRSKPRPGTPAKGPPRSPSQKALVAPGGASVKKGSKTAGGLAGKRSACGEPAEAEAGEPKKKAKLKAGQTAGTKPAASKGKQEKEVKSCNCCSTGNVDCVFASVRHPRHRQQQLGDGKQMPRQ